MGRAQSRGVRRWHPALRARPRPRTALLLLRALRRPVVDLVVVLPALVPQTWPAGHRALHYRIIADGDDDELVVSYVVLELEYSTTIDIALISKVVSRVYLSVTLKSSTLQYL